MYDNCFGSNGSNGCNILTVNKCLQDKCSFYKSTQELEEDRKKAYLLLAALPPDMQRYIWISIIAAECHGRKVNVLFSIPDEIFMR
ncbi:hypothetical protein [Thermoanaerobacterium thermosaccharolyticum]|uniref:hypothetical protein n=1 Tax=Thermoanaerobacterium thermosaccharolyticum TaxID=1517 RepID=UPI00211AA6D9|nr:hypothetical protein [Thermoanaerobacterium thermosaccharolyticum]